MVENESLGTGLRHVRTATGNTVDRVLPYLSSAAPPSTDDSSGGVKVDA
jgi:hypothetical protein